MERFRTCDECSRHVRTAEAKCPFCGHALGAATLMSVPRAPAQLSRAQRIALVAAMAGGLAACGDDAVGSPGPRAGAGVAGAAAGTGAAGASGAAAGSGGTGTAGKGAAGSPPIAVPVYGAPFPVPAGSGGGGGNAGKSGAGGTGDAGGAAGSAGAAGAAGARAGAGGAAGVAGHPMIQPLYGASPAYGVPPTPPKK